MKVTIFSSNQPRHLNLAREFSKIAKEVFFISEVTTLFPGRVDDFYSKSETMQIYFSKVINSELKVFGDICFLPENVKHLSMKMNDLNFANTKQLFPALNSDLYVIFGSSYIKGWLIDFLVDKKAINIHMGISPYYRGSSCNFWATYDNNPGYVGGTIHYLNKGLDSGDILFHCIPRTQKDDSSFDFTMRSVLATQKGLVKAVKSNEIFTMKSFKQDKTSEIRYSKNSEFNDSVAKEYLDTKMKLDNSLISYPKLINPFFY